MMPAPMTIETPRCCVCGEPYDLDAAGATCGSCPDCWPAVRNTLHDDPPYRRHTIRRGELENV